MESKSDILLTQKEKEIVDSMHDYLKNHLKRKEPFICDIFIFRFLVARKWDIDKTKAMFDKLFEFRDKMIILYQDKYFKNIGIIIIKSFTRRDF